MAHGTANPTSALAVANLRKRYGELEALQGIGLQVAQGEIFGLLGANGAGKSTLIKILVGALRPSAGEVRVLGLDPLAQAAALRRQLGYMPQLPALYEDLSPRENVRFFGRAYGLDQLERRIDEVLEFTALRARERDPVHEFSGGMRQRVSLACALVHRPRLLLLDEPSAGVDPKLREAFWQHFRELAAGGATLLVSTHQMDEAFHCDRVAIMRDGAILACDTPRNIMRRGRTRVRLQVGEEWYSETLSSYEEQLPRLLQRYRLDAAVSRIELEEDSLESIVLDMIAAQELQQQPAEEAPHVTHA